MRKIGSKVTIRSTKWYNRNKDEQGYVDKFVPSMEKFCGKQAIITGIAYDRYMIDIDDGLWLWSDYMFEGSKEKPKPELKLSKEEIEEIQFCLARVQDLAYSECEFRRSIMDKLQKYLDKCV